MLLETSKQNKHLGAYFPPPHFGWMAMAPSQKDRAHSIVPTFMQLLKWVHFFRYRYSFTPHLCVQAA